VLEKPVLGHEKIAGYKKTPKLTEEKGTGRQPQTIMLEALVADKTPAH